ncbi:MAG: hypothetical protein LBT64_00445 [Puniceicoccales bacterium]|jgi:hypothetical protein|nr:hypothetical protein [Puniceicoccales bacterium]
MAIDSPKVSKKKMALDAAKMHFDNSDALAKKDGCEVDSSREKSRGYVASAKAFADYKDFSQTGHQLLLAGQSSLAAGDYVEASKIYTKAAGSFILAKDFVGRDSAMSLAGEALFLGERYAEAANVFTEAGNLEKAAKMRELAKMQAANVAQISVAGSEK